MAKTKPAANPHAFKLDPELVTQRHALARSGAAGIHADQKTRKNGTFRTNRVTSRRARIQVAAKDGW